MNHEMTKFVIENCLNCIVIKPYDAGMFETESEVMKGWNQNMEFRTPFERNASITKSAYIEYGNKMDGIIFEGANGLQVMVKTPIT